MAYRTNFHKITRKRSFTLLETIVAIYVLLAGIVGAMNLTQQNIGAITLFRHQLIAVNLAQEGAELVRNRRDSNSLDCYNDAGCFTPGDNPNKRNMSGMIDLGADCQSAQGCRVSDPLSSIVAFERCDNVPAAVLSLGSACRFLRFNPATGVYDYNAGSGVSSIFDRRITLTKKTDRDLTSFDDDLHDWEVKSTVRWCEKLDCTTKVVEVRSVLTPHKSRQ